MKYHVRHLPKLVCALIVLMSQVAWACPTCGEAKGFTPQMLLMTMTFALLPLSIMLLLAWRIMREDESRKGDRQTGRDAFLAKKKMQS